MFSKNAEKAFYKINIHSRQRKKNPLSKQRIRELPQSDIKGYHKTPRADVSKL